MISSTHPTPVYQQYITGYEKELRLLNRRSRALGWTRLLSVLAAGISGWQLWPLGLLPAAGGFLIFFTIFLYAVSLDVNNKALLANTKTLLRINQQEITALRHEFSSFATGSEYMPSGHPYAEDLDILGPGSVYQFANRTCSEQGSLLFASWLLHPASAETVARRQAAVRELIPATEWRQQLQAIGTEQVIRKSTEHDIMQWSTQPDKFRGVRGWSLLRIGGPATALTLLALHIGGWLPAAAFYPCVAVFLVFSFYITGRITPLYKRLNQVSSELDTLSASVRYIEKKTFQSDLLQELQHAYQNQEPGISENPGNSRLKRAKRIPSASSDIRALKRILDRMDYRFNMLLFLPLNTFLFWDLQMGLQLEEWRARHRNKLSRWFESLANFEALASLGTLAFNKPAWSFPLLSESEGAFEAIELGHPLINPESRVANNFSTTGAMQLALITGSNMAGKSTFLRSVGVNIVLAMAGAPVCAEKLTLSPLSVMSSMRIADNLNESTSTFYAELKKLKLILEQVQRGDNVFLLLDEILRGTNSLDRHAGSKALVRQLLKYNAVGMIATHDIELAKMEQEYPKNIRNYHFDVQVANDELYFDYRLKKGVCQSMNASILMKKIGIELS